MRPGSKGTELASSEQGTVIRAKILQNPPKSYRIWCCVRGAGSQDKGRPPPNQWCLCTSVKNSRRSKFKNGIHRRAKHRDYWR